MTQASSGTHPVLIEQDVVLARQLVRKLAQDCGMRLIDLTKLVTAVSELARNTVVYGGGGYMDWAVIEKDHRPGVRLTFRDEGPGIPDLKLAMTDGWTSGARNLGECLLLQLRQLPAKTPWLEPGTA